MSVRGKEKEKDRPTAYREILIDGDRQTREKKRETERGRETDRQTEEYGETYIVIPCNVTHTTNVFLHIFHQQIKNVLA